MGSSNFPNSKGQLHNGRLRGCVGFWNEVRGKCRTDCEWNMFRGYDCHVCVSGFGSRLWTLRSVVAPGLDGDMLGVPVLYDVYQAPVPMARWNGHLHYSIHCICEYPRSLQLSSILTLVGCDTGVLRGVVSQTVQIYATRAES
jgi:hypothetical protein